MSVKFKSYDRLALYIVVARYLNFTLAAVQLNMTKGAVSYQIKCLEADVGFALFERQSRGVSLTDKGLKLLSVSKTAFDLIDDQP